MATWVDLKTVRYASRRHIDACRQRVRLHDLLARRSEKAPRLHQDRTSTATFGFEQHDGRAAHDWLWWQDSIPRRVWKGARTVSAYQLLLTKTALLTSCFSASPPRRLEMSLSFVETASLWFQPISKLSATGSKRTCTPCSRKVVNSPPLSFPEALKTTPPRSRKASKR